MSEPQLDLKPSKFTYAGLCGVALSTLMFEILLTRIFSVTMWYHFAFMAISLGMFGMTVGAMIVYLNPKFFTPDRTRSHLASSALIFAVLIIIGFMTHIVVPFMTPESWQKSLVNMMLTYTVIALPFIFSGVNICLALTRFGKDVGRLYAADLLGAGAGCLLLVPMLGWLDAPSAVFMVAALAALSGVIYSLDRNSENTIHRPTKRLTAVGIILMLVLAGSSLSNALIPELGKRPLKLQWVQGVKEETPLFERWNSFSRVRVYGDPENLRRPFAWGLSQTWPEDKKISELTLLIDSGAATVLTKFDGDLDRVEHLKHDLTNLVHSVRPDSKVLVVGVGGGRDILSSLAFKQKSVDGVEINENIIKVLVDEFGDYTGHLDRRENVKIINDEARCFIGKSREKYDIIQISLIDTFAATASGAFVLTEHSLYTLEAWRSFIDHLTDDGILTLSRWYFADRPAEAYRLLVMAAESLEKAGFENPREHIAMVASMGGGSGGRIEDGVCTILLSKSPLTKTQLTAIDRFAEENLFKVIVSPEKDSDSFAARIADGKNLASLISDYSMDISASTDNRPFFLHMTRLKDMFNLSFLSQGIMSPQSVAIMILGLLLFTVTFLTLACIVVPLILTADKSVLSGSKSFLLYFASIGFGFMFIEISQMQRLIVFLGHPVYGLTVALFTLLVASGIGSFSTTKLPAYTAIARLMSLVALLALFGTLTPWLIESMDGASTAARISLAAAILFPLGFFMGMAFPIGMSVASVKSKQLTPWLWGVNGATSVCASVLAVAIAFSFGISATFWTGTLCYAAATAAYLLMIRKSLL